ncbi:uncharacterized protein JCM6883_004150 [Sporobolomyces salmoneus]|uniref:uncharacterized protein n=1 Tax=Sporobolomyces salmoneus TaxID=183962 RepID=UPI00316C25BB
MSALARQGAHNLTRSTLRPQAAPLPAKILNLGKLRPLSSTSKTRDSLLSEQDPVKAEKETEAVTRLERLLKVSERLSRGNSQVVPLSMKGLTPYSKDHTATLPVEESLEDLEPLPKERTMKDSFCSMDLKFSEDEALREEFVGGLSKVRMSAILEKFDWLAGSSAYQHVLPNGTSVADASKYGFYLVTAAVERMDMLRPLYEADGSVPDLRLAAHVAYATESSLEVFVRLSTITKTPSESRTILIGRFTMVCRSSKGGKHAVPRLIVKGPEEEEMFEMGRELRETKKKRASKSLERRPPTEEEAAMLHDLFLKNAQLYDRKTATPANILFMADTRIRSANLMHPQYRNLHNKIFGGKLMSTAYETAYSTACLFARSPVTFVALDELQFAQPVEVGSLLVLDSRVTFSSMVGEHKSFHVSVEAATVDLHTGEKKITNTFHFTFSSEKPLERHVLPRTYRQAMQWLDAQRRRSVGIEVRKTYESP